MKNNITRTFGLLALAATFAAWPLRAADASPAKLPIIPATKPLKLAFITYGPSDFWKFAQVGCDKAASELKNVQVIFKQPPDGSPAQQKQIVDDLLAAGVMALPSARATPPIKPQCSTLRLGKPWL